MRYFGLFLVVIVSIAVLGCSANYTHNDTVEESNSSENSENIDNTDASESEVPILTSAALFSKIGDLSITFEDLEQYAAENEDLNIQDDDGNTLIMLAVQTRDPAIIQIIKQADEALENFDVDLAATNNLGLTAIDYIINESSFGNIVIEQDFNFAELDAGGIYTALQNSTAINENREMALNIEEYSSSINAVLIEAGLSDHFDLVMELLIKKQESITFYSDVTTRLEAQLSILNLLAEIDEIPILPESEILTKLGYYSLWAKLERNREAFITISAIRSWYDSETND